MISRNNKGITLIALVITIVVLLIIASISIVGGIEGAETAAENKLLTELDMVQHAVLERYTKVCITKEIVPGSPIDYEEMKNELTEYSESPKESTYTITDVNNVQSNQQNDIGTYQYYYRLDSNALKELGITNTKDTYIVNYSTGEVLNETTPKTSSGKILYTYAKDNTESK